MTLIDRGHTHAHRADPPQWPLRRRRDRRQLAARLGGLPERYLKAGACHDVSFIGAVTHHLSDEQARERLVALQPDVLGCTATTPAI
jgi:hypothetical protein